MKTRLELRDHLVLAGERVVEVWYAGAFIASIAGADGPGVRIFSKHRLTATAVPSEAASLGRSGDERSVTLVVDEHALNGITIEVGR